MIKILQMLFKKMELVKVDASSETSIDLLFNNPGYSHIAEKILWYLDHNSQLRCKLVCRSWKALIDKPQFWIKKCYPIFKKSFQYDHRDIWLEIANEMKVSETGQKSLLKILMQKYIEEFVSDQVDGCVCRYKTFLNQSKDVQNDWKNLGQNISTLTEKGLKMILIDKYGNPFENLPSPEYEMKAFLKALKDTSACCGICFRHQLNIKYE